VQQNETISLYSRLGIQYGRLEASPTIKGAKTPFAINATVPSGAITEAGLNP
jgi:hypothetical protein